MINIITSGVYGHSIVLFAALLLVPIFTKFEQGNFMYVGMFVFILWFLVEFFFVLRAEQFWMGVVHLTLISLVAYGLFILVALACGKYGIKAQGDGAGWGLLSPLFIYLYVLIPSLLLKVILFVWNYLFGTT